MKDRRRIRRSSPDAPQGVVPVMTILVGLLAVIVLVGAGLRGSQSETKEEAVRGSAVRTEGERVEQAGSTVAAPSTALIRGSTTTMLFVTTTTPITTTTSTTTTSLAGPALDADGAEIVFAPGQRSVTFTVRSASEDGIDFLVTGVPRGMAVSPTAARVSEGSPVTITLRITDPSSARSGVIVLVGSDGSRASIRVRVDDGSFAISQVSFDPSPPVCGTRSQVVASVSGDSVRSVTATMNVGGRRIDASMTRRADGTLAAVIPDAAPGSAVTGAITAVDGTGETTTRSFSTAFVDGPACTR